MSEGVELYGLRPFPDEAKSPGATVKFLATYRKAFDADPHANFCAGEIDGLVLVVARSDRKAGEKLRLFITDDLGGVIQRRVT